ncbi:hypothetical protein GOEFS_017_00390 [Gordonia effusa NBRC 100432]|uniref:Pycsar effector protein domain-containing protein n=1 Tax=Gordonia effusa NBRC 100432 TaxID=1077974 RepID=H0QVS2_9ACTN|nr:Pycsar system effector family protein [Gordonia effusa]GAB16923.1 hypothetical protein GOEFS_017_00390 [Gordonia effusa NBRC 100432]
MTPDSSPLEETMLAEARIDVAQADHKATLILTMLGVGGGALLAGVLAGSWKPAYYNAVGEVVWWFAAAAAAGSLVAAAAAVWPRWKKNDSNGHVFYWGHVATHTDVTALGVTLDHQQAQRSDRTRYQLFELSHIVAKKYRCVRAAMILAGLAGAVFGLAALIG